MRTNIDPEEFDAVKAQRDAAVEALRNLKDECYGLMIVCETLKVSTSDEVTTYKILYNKARAALALAEGKES